MKKVLLVAAFAFGFSSAFAQLSTRENDATSVKLGARPVKGDMSLTFALGLSKDSGTASLFNGNLLGAGDLLTFKKYREDDLAIRFGVRLQQDKVSESGTSADSSAFVPVPANSAFKTQSNTREWVIVPGIEKHFNAGNIFDVYTGADLYLGFKNQRTISNIENTKTSDFSNIKQTTNNTVVGLGWIVGFNVFVAQLPISVGLEYGLNAKWDLGGKTKNVLETKVGGETKSDEFFTRDGDATQYQSLHKRQFGMDTNQNVRLAVNIFFGR
jgi:hypothetical protein